MSLPALYVPQHVGDAADPATSRRVIEYLRAAAEVAGATIEAQDDEKIVLSAPSIGSAVGSYKTLTIRVREDHGALVCEADGNPSMGGVWLQIIIAALLLMGSLMMGLGADVKTWILTAFLSFSAWQSFQAPRRRLSEWLSGALERVALQPATTLLANPEQRHDLAKLTARLQVSGGLARRRVRLSLVDGSILAGHLTEVTPSDVTIDLKGHETRQIALSDVTAIDGAVPRVWLYRGVAGAFGAGIVLLPVAMLASGSHSHLSAGMFTALVVGGGTVLLASFTVLRKWFTKWERWLGDKPQ